MDFFRVWLSGYHSPAKFARGLEGRPAPQWGLYALLLRALLLSLLTYLPLYLGGQVPPTPSYLPALPTATYYGALIWLTPLVLAAQWLLGGAIAHLVLRLSHHASDIDAILNVYGMAALVVGAFLILWDWVWIWVGSMDQILLGVSHLVLDLWGVVLTALSLKRALDVPIWLGALLTLLTYAAGLALAIVFMRSPL